jgi:Fe-S cluster assembly protein SufA
MEVQAGTFNPADFSWQGLTMTPAAAAHIRDLMRKQPDKKGLRLGIKTSGCAGFGYVLEMIAEPAADDLLFELTGRNCGRRCRRCRSLTARSWITSGKV